MIDLDQLAAAVDLSAEQRELLSHLLSERQLATSNADSIARVATDRPPLSFAQQRLWFLYRLNPESNAYNMPAAVSLHGRLAVSALARSLGEVVRRHEALRSRFADEEGVPVIAIAPPEPVPLPVVDLAGLPAPQRRAEGRRVAREEAGRPFDLRRDVLLRAVLVRSGASDHLAVITLHHIASDGWSIGVLVGELADLYRAFAAGRPSPLAELGIQYGDFARWQRGWLSGDVLARQLTYWRERMAGAPAVLDLPADRPRPPVPSLRGGSLEVRLDAGPVSALKALGQRSGATLFMVALAAFQTLLGRSAATEDVVVGSPIANRTRAESEPLIGFFVNTLVLRCHLTGDPAFEDFLERVREVTLGAYAHQDLPFEKLVEELRLERSTAAAPLFQVVLALQNAPAPRVELEGLEFALDEVDRGAEKFDLTLNLEESARGLRGTLSYSRDLFDRTTALRLWTHLEALLDGVLAAPERRLSELSFLAPGERHQVLWEWSGSEIPTFAEDSIPRRFAACVERFPDAVALVSEAGHCTYRELGRSAGRLARLLLSQGLAREDVVGICVERSSDGVLAMLAVLVAGGAYLPLDPALPAERLDLLLANAQRYVARPLVFARRHSAESLAGFIGRGGSVLPLDGPHPSGAGEGIGLTDRTPEPDQLAYVIYTSGSTGEPKGVAVAHRGVLRVVVPSGWLAAGPQEVFLQLVTTSFDVSVMEIWGALLNGGRLVVPPAERPSLSTLGQWLERWQVTTLWLTAGLFREMVSENLAGLAGLGRLLAGGDVVALDGARQVLRELPHVRLVNGYGPTEGTIFTCCGPVDELGPAATSVPIGRPIASTQVYVVDRRGGKVPIGVPGELLTGGDGVARGYIGQPEKTAERFVPDPFSRRAGSRLYRTGDLVRQLSDGRVEFLGRLDRQVKIRGFRIEPGEVEAAIAGHEGVDRAYVTSRPLGGGERALVAYLVPRSAAELSPAALRSHLGRALPDYMLPAAFVLLEAMPLTANGKVDEGALPEPQLAVRQEGGEPTLARGAVEEILGGIWADLLGLADSQPGPADDFFALGGHSLLAMRLVARVATVFAVSLPLSAIFEAPTLSRLAAVIEPLLGRNSAAAPPAILARSSGEEVPLSYGQERLWFLDQLAPGEALYNVPVALRLAGRLSVPALAAGLAEVVRRHEVLRTSFVLHAMGPVQVIAPPGAFALPRIDLAGLPAAAREAGARGLAERLAQRPFELAHGPLLRAALVALSDTDHLLVLVLHHIVADGESLNVLALELQALYGAVVEGRPVVLPALQVQYADFALWQRRWLSGERLQTELAWWQERLHGMPQRLSILGERARPVAAAARGGVHRFSLARELSTALLKDARQRGTTPFMILLAALASVLYRYTGEEDFGIGAPIANRGRAELEKLIGFFVNTQVLRLDVSASPTWEGLLARVRQTALAAYAHQDVPFEKLVERLVAERTDEPSPLVQVVLALHAVPRGVLRLPGLAVAPLALRGTGAKFDLALELTWTAEGFEAVAEYRPDRLDAGAVARLAGHFTTLLAAALEAPGEPLSELPLLSAGERLAVLAEGNRTAVPFDRALPVHWLVAEQARRAPGAPAVVAGGLALTYGDLDLQAERLAGRLRALGVGPEVPVALCAERSPALVVAALAILKAGGAYVPLDPSYPQDRLAFMLADLGHPLILADERGLGVLPASSGEIIALAAAEDSGPADAERLVLAPALRSATLPEHRAYLIYTSGSTGRPKGVEIEHGSLSNLVAWHRTTYSVEPGDRATLISAPAFDAAVWEIWPYLAAGASLHVPAEEIRASPPALAAWLCAERITLCFLPTPLAEALLDEPGLEGACLRALLTGGDRLHRPPRRGLGFRLVNHYGPTEGTVVATAADVPAGPGEATPAIGLPIANTSAYLVDRWAQAVPMGVAGELAIGGAGLARGYWRRPDLTAERFVPDPWGGVAGGRLYRTGDLARRRPGGELDFLGRIDHQVKVRGFRIELGEIEAVLAGHPGVGEVAVVLGTGALPGVHTLTACLTGRGEMPPGPGELRAYLAARLPAHMVPAAFLVLATLPHTAHGKVDRKALARLQPATAGAVPSGGGALTPVEELLAGIWGDLLGCGPVGPGDDFFALGGHSLLATRLASRVREVFAVELPLRRLFEASTLAGLAHAVEALQESAGGGLAAPAIAAVSASGPLALSYPQERLWFLDRFEPGSTALNIPAFLSLEGPLVVTALARSLSRVIGRHAILRTTFEAVDGRPFQRITPPLPIDATPLATIDLSSLGLDSRQAELERVAAQTANHSLDLERGPLLVARLVVVAPRRHAFLLTVHHIVADGWSMSVFVRELQAFYAAEVNGTPSPFPPPALQYADFAAWQRGQLTEEAFQPALAYWRERLGGELPALDLPFDRPRGAVQTFRGDAVVSALSADLAADLAALCRREGGTLFMALLTGFAALLARQSGQRDILVGTPVAGRTRAEVEGMVGCFLNTLVLRSDLADEPSFTALLARVRETCLGAYAHQDLPFERLLSELAPDRDLSRTPLFQVFFNLINVPRVDLGLPDLAIEIRPLPAAPSKFDLTLYLSERADGIALQLVYNADLFGRARMVDLLAQFALLLSQAVAEPERSLFDLTLVTAAAKGLLPDPHAELSAAFYGSVPANLTLWAGRAPEALALSDPAEIWTYAALEAQANRLGQALVAAGIRPGDVVAIYAHRSAPLVWGVLGVLKAGAVFLLLDPSYPAARQAVMLRLARPRACLTVTAAGPLPDELEAELTDCLWRLDLGAQQEGGSPSLRAFAAEPPAVAIGADDPAYLAFTSGSTGTPKGILGRHGSLSHFIPWQRERFGLVGADRFSLLSGLAHDPLHRDMFTPLQLGAAIIVPDPEGLSEGRRLAGWMARQAITVAHLTPAMGQLLTADLAASSPAAGTAPNAGGERVGSLRWVLLVGDVLTRQDADRLRRLAPGVTVVNLYGSTETQRAVGYHLVEPAAQAAGGKEILPLGKGIEDVQLLVTRRGGALAGIGEVGEIFVRSPHLALGYLGLPEQSRERFLTNPATGQAGDRLYRTGDLGRYLPDGEVEFAGRADQQVKIRGFRIELGEIEATLARHPAVEHAVVLLLDDAGEKYLAAYVVPALASRPSDDDLRAFLRAQLPAYMVPAAYVLLDELPVTPNRKVDRRALPIPRRGGGDDAKVAPRNPEEEVLAAIWSELLGLDEVGIHDNFFDLGGHSLKATQLVSRVRRAFDLELPLRTLFEAPTVAALAQRLGALRAEGSGQPPLVAAAQQGDAVLSFAQERLWFLAQMEPDNPALNLSTVISLTGRVDPGALARSLDEIVRRHEALRTRFAVAGGGPVQQVLPFLDLASGLVDLAGLPEVRRRAEQSSWVSSEARRPFDTLRGPLLRSRLFRLAADEHVLALVFHHIVADGWSLGVFFHELTELYRAFVAGGPSPLPPLPVQYADFARWQRDWLSGEAYSSRLAYWKGQLEGRPPALELPTDRPRPTVRSFRGARATRQLPRPLAARLEALSRGAGCTLFMTLLACFEALLNRYTGEEDILVGSPIAHRNRQEIEPLIGVFFNLLALRLRPVAQMPFRDLLAHVRETAFAAYAHQDLPFEKLLEELHPERHLSRTPLFQVVFVLQNTALAPAALPGLTLRLLETETRTSNFDLTLFLSEHAGGLQAVAEYKVELFDAATIARLLEHFATLAEAAVDHPESPLSRLPMLRTEERRQLIAEWNDTATDFPREDTLPELFWRRARLAPDLPAVLAPEGGLTYRELAGRAARLCRLLVALGVGRGSLVAVCMDRSADMVPALLGILAAGAAYVPLDPAFPEARLQWIFAAMDIRVAVVRASQVDLLAALPDLPLLSDLVCMDEPVADAGGEAGRARVWPLSAVDEPAAPPTLAGTADDLAYIIFTSGSTGTPKGVMVRHRAAVNLIRWVNDSFAVGPADRLLFTTSLCFDLSVYDVLGTLAAGGALRVATSPEVKDPEVLVRILVEESITFWDSAPAALQHLAPFLPVAPSPATGCLRLVFLSGDWIPLALPDRIRQCFPRAEVISLGGATEATVWSNSYPYRGLDPHWVSIPYGRPIQNARYHVLDNELEPCPVGVHGDLYIAGECLSAGYALAPELTAVKYVPDPLSGLAGERLYRTGDRARYRADGNLEFLGRLDQQVKIRGFRIELGEIEAVLGHHPAVGDAIVLAREDSPGDKRLVAYVTRASRAAAEPDAERQSDQIAHWKMVYEETYRQAAELPDPTFNVAGWISSYDGAPIAPEEMREWVDGTVQRILAHAPRRVLEIGCGTGLLLFRIAPTTERYWATDISAASLALIEGQLAGRELAEIRLLERSAEDWSGIPAGSFDAVVINSVTQHFPGPEYLRQVIEGAVASVADGGFVYVGDVRSLPHLEAFHASVQSWRAPQSLPRDAFAAWVDERVEGEEELVVDPRFFRALQEEIPRISRLDLQLQPGRGHNEVTRFRFSAILSVGAPASAAVVAPTLDWQAEGLTLQDVRFRLAAEEPKGLILRRVPNARLAAEARLLSWMRDDGSPQTLGEMRRALAIPETLRGTLDPEDFWQIGRDLPYEVTVAWSPSDPVGCFDVVFARRAAAEGGAPALVENVDGPRVPPARDWRELTNDPLHKALSGKLAAELRQHVASRLPEYMIPAAILVLDAFPVTSNGKLDRQALPAPDAARTQAGAAYIPPRTEVERRIAEIWSQVLGAPQVGVSDHFFDLGGHSLLATQAVSRLRQAFGIELSLRALFEAPTIDELARVIESCLAEAASGAEPAVVPLLPIARQPGRGLPLSYAQERLWFITQFAPGSTLYHVPVAVRLEGELDVAVLAGALRAVVARHEALRTTFAEVHGAPQQLVHPTAELPFAVLDLRALAALAAPQSRSGDPSAIADAAADRFARCPFDLTRGPLLRALLVELGAGERRLVLVLHHIVSDGWSVGVLMRELATLYAALLAGRPSPLPALPVQYADFAAWQRCWLQGDVLAAQLSYWRDQLAGAPPVLALPTDRPRPAVQTFHGARRLFRLPSALAVRLREWAREVEATPFMVLLAAFQSLLARHSGQDDVSVGTPIANRNRQETEPLVGFFVNTLVLRTRLFERPSFAETVARVRQVALGAFAHQDLPFEKLLQELHPERDVSHPALFQVLFALQNMELPKIELAGLRLTLLTSEAWAANFDLSLLVAEGGGDLAGGLGFNTDLFDPSTAERLAGHFVAVLTEALAEPRRGIAELALLGEGERHELSIEWNDPIVHHPSEGCAHQLFEAQAARAPEAPAVIADGVRLSYRQVNERAERLARRLRASGVGPETLVGICLDRSPALVIAMLAVHKAGGAFVPLAPEHPEERLASILASTGLGVLLTVAALADRLPRFAGEMIVLDDAGLATAETLAEREPAPPAATPDHLAYVMYTSGSTGMPKGVMIPHRGLFNRVAFAMASRQVLPGDRFLHKASISFDVSLLEIFLPLAAGGAIVVARPGGHQDPAYLVELMAREEVHQAIFPPSLLRAVVEEEGLADCRHLRAVASSAEALPLDLQERFFSALSADLYNRYGPTEASIAVTSWKCERHGRERTVPIGRPIAGTAVFVLDSSGRPAPLGVPGELQVGGVCLGRGYFRAADLTAEKFVPNPFSRLPGERLYRTGDLVRFRRDGAVEFLGRIDHQVKIRGVRIELGEVEAALERHPRLGQVAVIDRETAGGGRELVAYYVHRPGEECAAAELRGYLRQILPEVMVPAAYVRLETLPLLPSGKLDRAALPAPAKVFAEALPDAAFDSALEETIAGLWREVLELPAVGRDDNFFDLGGHSLLVIKVRSRLQQALAREIPIVDLFRHPTIAALARHLAPQADSRQARVVGRGSEPGRGAGEIAIIGMAGRFPGAASVELLWHNLCAGVESISAFTEEEVAACGVSLERLRDPRYVRSGGVLDGIDLFDAELFGIPDGEAELLDPQHRLFLECSWEALEKAGCDPAAGTRRIGVFGGAGMNTYLLSVLSPNELVEAVSGFPGLVENDKDYLTSRVSHALGLNGPSMAIQSACSTSLAAVHLACLSLSAGECDVALAGGASVAVPQKTGYLFQPGMILSPDGHCRAFDAGAEGTVRGNGVGVVVLKRLAEALADGDHIHAVIKGSAMNNDGAAKIGYTAPSAAGQAQVVADALSLAGVQPSTIDYVEAHGTGTRLGDPIEIDALTQVFGPGAERHHPCLLGSVKTNVGHLNAAAGVTGLIKATLAVEHAQVPPSLHFETPNPEIDFAAGPFRVSSRLTPWESSGAPRRAGVSSFGLGGTNVHCVLESAPPAAEARPAPLRPCELVAVSARTPEAFARLAQDLAVELRRRPELSLADVAFTLLAGRRRFPYRGVVVCRDLDEAVTALSAPDSGRLTRGWGAAEAPVALLFPGLAGHRPGLGGELQRWEPAFRDAIDRSVRSAGGRLDADPRVELFAFEHALALLLSDWGLRPEALSGQGVGALAAATCAGVFSLADALAIVRALPGLPGDGREAASGVVPPALWAAVRRATLAPPRIPLAMGAMGGLLTPAEASDAEFWVRRLARPESLVASDGELPFSSPQRILVEVGAGRLPAPLADGHPNQAGGPSTLPLLAEAEERGGELPALLAAMGQLWLAGVAIDGRRLHAGARRQRVDLPIHPFARRRFWLDRGTSAAAAVTASVQPASPIPPSQAPRAAAARPACRVELQAGGRGTPLFLIHPAGGHLTLYSDLVAALGGAFPIHGFHAAELEGEVRGSTVEELAERYTEELVAAQPAGACRLAGSSIGGAIAFEMALRLERQGRFVELVALLDVPGPGQLPAGPAAAAGGGLLAQASLSPRDLDPAAVQRFLARHQEHEAALRRYVPGPYPGRVVFLRARSRRRSDARHPEYPWIEVAQGGIDVEIVPGDPVSMFRPPHLQAVVERLRRHLDPAGTAPSSVVAARVSEG